MRKILSIIMLLVSVTVFGQTAIETPKFFDNTFAGANIGVTTPLTFSNVQKNLNPTVGVKVGKWFNPIFGVNIEGKAWFNSDFSGDPYLTQKNFVEATYVGVNSVINWSNALFGYKQDRRFNINSELGVGWIHLFNPAPVYDHNDFGAKTGLDLVYHFSDKWALNIEPAIYWDLSRRSNINPSATQTVQFSKTYAQASVSVGVTYNFRTSNGTHTFKAYNISSMNDEINSLKEALAKKPTEVKVTRIIKDTQIIDRQYVVFFAQNSSSLTDDAKAVLSDIPEGSKVTVKGSASPEGTKEYNKSLSERRARTVADFLSARNITVDNWVGNGVTDNTSGRVVVVTIKD